MEYKDITIGQKLLLCGVLGDTYESEVVAVDPRRESLVTETCVRVWGAIQIRTVLHPGEAPHLLWVNPDRLMESVDY